MDEKELEARDEAALAAADLIPFDELNEGKLTVKRLKEFVKKYRVFKRYSTMKKETLLNMLILAREGAVPDEFKYKGPKRKARKSKQ